MDKISDATPEKSENEFEQQDAKMGGVKAGAVQSSTAQISNIVLVSSTMQHKFDSVTQTFDTVEQTSAQVISGMNLLSRARHSEPTTQPKKRKKTNEPQIPTMMTAQMTSNHTQETLRDTTKAHTDCKNHECQALLPTQQAS